MVADVSTSKGIAGRSLGRRLVLGTEIGAMTGGVINAGRGVLLGLGEVTS